MRNKPCGELLGGKSPRLFGKGRSGFVYKGQKERLELSCDDDCCVSVWAPMSDTVTTFALRDLEKFDYSGSSAADYLLNCLSIR